MSVIVVSAPSGAGKSTLHKLLLAECPDVSMSISHTTRQPRQGEDHGVAYHFIDTSKFKEMTDNREFIEWAEVHGNYYGTSFSELERINSLGKSPLLEIDVQGWLFARKRLPNPLSIFILPPSLKLLWDRLEGRGSDDLATRWVRFQNAYKEIEEAGEYENFVINDDLQTAYKELKHIIETKNQDTDLNKKGMDLVEKLKDEFKNAEWIKNLRPQL
jgi:guanylate kinase